MNKRSTLGGGTLLALALLFIGLTILFNYALRGWRLDLTQNRLYTIAPGTDRILASVKEPINLYFFFSEKTAGQLPEYKTYAARMRDSHKQPALRARAAAQRLAEISSTLALSSQLRPPSSRLLR